MKNGQKFTLYYELKGSKLPNSSIFLLLNAYGCSYFSMALLLLGLIDKSSQSNKSNKRLSMYTNKNISTFVIQLKFFLIILSLLLLPVSVTSAEPIKIRFSHIVAEDTPKGKMALRFKSLVQQRLGNEKVVVDIYPNSTLFGDNNVVDELLNNNVELAAPSMSKLKKFTKRVQVLDIPFLFVSPEAANNFLKGPYGKRMLRLVSNKGLIGLGYLNNGMKQLSANSPIQVPTDIQGLRFRIMNSDVLEAQFNQVGAKPVRKPFKEVYNLLKTKEIDGQENTWSNIFSKKFYEYQPHIIESNHGYLGYMVMSSKSFWESMPVEIKEIVEKSLADALEYGNEVALEKVVSDRANILATGKSDIHIMSLAERRAWVTAMQPVWKSYENEIGSELILAAASAR
jgi:C4-dicarboxylate-binding protein DctP